MTQQLRRVISTGLLFFLLVPSAAFGATPGQDLLTTRDVRTVTRGDFVKAAVRGAKLPLIDSGDMPYDGVPVSMQAYIRAAHARGALKALAKGRMLNLRSGIRRGEAIAVLSDILQVAASGTSDAVAKPFTDATSDADRRLISLAIERNWMKPVSETVFGLREPLKGKEGKLLFTRVFQLAPKDPSTETFSSPVIRVQLKGLGSRQPVPKSDLLEEIWNTLRLNYLYQDRMDADKVSDKAIEGLVNALGDPYTTYMPKTRSDDFKQQMKGEVEGIGATVEMTGAILTIVSPLRGSPAEKAGLKPKDQILSVDGETLKGLSLDDAVRKVRGPKGSTAVLRIRRGSEEFDVTVTREKVLIPEVEIEYRQNGLAVVKILQFWDTTDKKFRDAMKEVQSKNPSGIILDLRNNPGGLLHAAGVVVGNFLPKGSTFATIMERDSKSTETTDEDQTISPSVKMVVLVNKGSASASEIVAGTLQDAKRATIVGETTYGKGTVQQVVQFVDGSSLKYTVAEWRTPLGRTIDKIGIVPDIVVTNEGALPGRDPQMDKAVDLLR